MIILSCSKDKDFGEEITPLTYQVSVEASEGGTVSTTGGSYQSGASLTITATPAEGYRFTGWSGYASGTTNPITVNVSGDGIITANINL